MSAALYEALAYQLQNDAGVSALVGTRIYPAGTTPSNAASPYMTYGKTLTDPVRHQQGASNLTMTIVSINCWGMTPQSAVAVADAVYAALDEFAGDMGDPAAPLPVRLILIDQQSNDTTPPIDNTESGRFVETLELSVWHENQTTPAGS